MIKILCVGSIKEKFYVEAIKEYAKRLSKYTKLEMIECKDYDFDNINIILEKEKDNLLRYISDKDYVITLEIDGKRYDSLSFSKFLDEALMINNNIVFIIGGSYGIHSDIKKRSNLSLSFSDFTFPHQLFRIILLEQIYRAFKIIKNESYHK